MNVQARTVLVLGDLLALIVVTTFGFATHGTLGSAGGRLPATFLPVLLGWAAVAPSLGVYDLERMRDVRQLWRPLWAMVLVAPFAAWLRGAWLGSPVIPIFVLVLAGFGGLGILAWRILFALVMRHSDWDLKKRNG